MEMPSRNLYPPTVDSYQAAFDTSADECRIYFSLSKFSTSAASVNAIQLSITNQATGVSVVNKNIASDNVFTNTGIIIINRKSNNFYIADENEDNLYYITIPNAWINNGTGWEPGKIYKAQIRLSEIDFTPSKTNTQASWLSTNTQYFSEWSTYTILKATGTSVLQLSAPSWNSEDATDSNTVTNIQYTSTTLELQGEYSNTDTSETLYCYEISIYDKTDTNLLDSSGKLYQNKTVESNKLYYLCPYELTIDTQYVIHIKILTINKYEKEYTIPIVASWVAKDICEVSLLSVEHDSPKIMRKLSTLEEENEEGRVALKIYTATPTPVSNNFIIRRAESTDNFKKWYDIKIINCNNKDPNDLEIFYDYTIESGVYYKYGIQTFKNNLRGIFNLDNTIMIQRNFEYAYLVGDNCQQLKLKFDNTMENFTPNVSDTKTDTIGGKYPFITRNGNMNYRSFPVNGLISFHMDDQNTFTSRNKLFIDDDITTIYNENNADNIFVGYVDPDSGTQKTISTTEIMRWDSHNDNNIIVPEYGVSTGTPDSSWIYDYDGNFYDIYYERIFREEVIDFLTNDHPKLFKSPTEGNIIIRLTDVKLTPNQSLGRLIYSFTSTAYEIKEATFENYGDLGINVEGEILEKFVTKEYHIGQYILEDYDLDDYGEPDLIKLIYEKYDKTNYNMVDTTRSLTKIYNLSLYFHYIPTLTTNNDNASVVGYNINLNGQQITIYAGRPKYYNIDESIELTPNSDTLIIMKSADTIGSNNKVTIVANFLYEMEISDYVSHITKSYSQTTGIGQISGNFEPNTNLYTLIYNKYYYNWPATSTRNDNQMRYLNTLNWASLEAKPNAVFQIRDASDSKSGEQHRINFTGILNLEDLTDTFYHIIYLGMWDDKTQKIISKPIDIILDYYYELITEVY